MSRERMILGAGGILLGALLVWGVADAVSHRNASRATAGVPAPSPAPGPGAVGTAPMMEEIRNLKRALEVEPGNAAALTRLANLYHDAGMWRQAVDAYEKAIAAGRSDANVITDLGVCYQQLKDFEKALEAFERAQKTDPTHWQSLYNIVIVAGFNLGRFDQAEAALDRLEKVNPGAPNLGSLRENLNQARASRGRSPA